jgi:uncharacterized protein YbcI
MDGNLALNDFRRRTSVSIFAVPGQHSTPPEHDASDDGGRLLAQISDEMVRAKKEFFGRGPTKAKSYVLDDVLLVVMRGGLTTAEKTMLEFGHPGQVREFRQLFQNAMAERVTKKIEELTGRRVVNYQSQVMFDPDVVVEMFIFDSDD